MRHAVLGKPAQMIARQLIGVGKYHGGGAGHGTQEHLQAAVTADVVNVAQITPAVGWLRPLKARVSPARLCTTSLGTPVVPDVSSIHSVTCETSGVRSSGSGCNDGSTRMPAICPCISAMGRSVTRASMSAALMIDGRCSTATSEGQITNRRAIPSNSMSASAVASWFFVARIDLPRKASS